jgi:hypothetical protein
MWRKRVNIDSRYADHDEVQKDEEAVAEAFSNWATGPRETPILVRIYQAVRDRLLGISAGFRRSGFADADHIFGRIESGEFGRRSGYTRKGLTGRQPIFGNESPEDRGLSRPSQSRRRTPGA